MKGLDLTSAQMLDIYSKEVRSILEMSVPVWHAGLTRKQSACIKRVQKLAFRIILGQQYKTYGNALNILKVQTLKERRLELCKKFALKNFKSEFSFFQPRQCQVKNRSKAIVQVYRCDSASFEKSSLPFLSKLLNQIQ